ncbi:MAG: hypothetical protein R3C59_10255 [Planctomycetaceae bacterium]
MPKEFFYAESRGGIAAMMGTGSKRGYVIVLQEPAHSSATRYDNENILPVTTMKYAFALFTLLNVLPLAVSVELPAADPVPLWDQRVPFETAALPVLQDVRFSVIKATNLRRTDTGFCTVCRFAFTKSGCMQRLVITRAGKIPKPRKLGFV